MHGEILLGARDLLLVSYGIRSYVDITDGIRSYEDSNDFLAYLALPSHRSGVLRSPRTPRFLVAQPSRPLGLYVACVRVGDRRSSSAGVCE